jgi:hypothetical protein
MTRGTKRHLLNALRFSSSAIGQAGGLDDAPAWQAQRTRTHCIHPGRRYCNNFWSFRSLLFLPLPKMRGESSMRWNTADTQPNAPASRLDPTPSRQVASLPAPPVFSSCPPRICVWSTQRTCQSWPLRRNEGNAYLLCKLGVDRPYKLLRRQVVLQRVRGMYWLVQFSVGRKPS